MNITILVLIDFTGPLGLSVLSHNPHKFLKWNKHFFKTNSNTTEVLLIGSKSTLAKSNRFSLCINGSSFSSSQQIKNLRPISFQSFQSNINNVCRSCYLQLCNISYLLPFITHKPLWLSYMHWSPPTLITVINFLMVLISSINFYLSRILLPVS